MKRRGFTPERMAVIRQMFKLLYRESLTLEQSLTAIGELAGEDVALMLAFLASAERGIVR